EHFHNAPTWVLAELENPDPAEADGAEGNGAAGSGAQENAAEERGAQGGAPGDVDLLARVHRACFYRAGTLSLRNGGRVIARPSPTATPPGAPLAAITRHGAGRVAVLADSDLFGDDCIDELDNASLWLNLVY